jgi:hypothetical protein
MNDELEQQQPTEVAFDELAALKTRADLMGIKYHPSTGIDKLKAKIDLQLAGTKESEVEIKSTKQKISNKDFLTHKEYVDLEFKRRKATASKLVRARVTCMNPAKKEWDGEIISVGSAKIGTFKKFVKFNTEDGWHIPNIIYEYMKDRKCSIFFTEKNHVGQKIRKAKLVNEFNIEVLPPLTKDELKALAQRQAMEAGKEA